ncbi:MAG TPA: type II toxin-antitoxin system death-on-curing family toxin [Chloroflexota bacterium]
MAAPRYLSVLEIQRLHEELMEADGAVSNVLDLGKLEGAGLRPGNAAYYNGADLFAQAATLMGGIAMAHAFEDGNKRLALVAGTTFLWLNNIRIIADSIPFGEQIVNLVNRVDALDNAEERLAIWLRAHATPVDLTPEQKQTNSE